MVKYNLTDSIRQTVLSDGVKYHRSPTMCQANYMDLMREGSFQSAGVQNCKIQRRGSFGRGDLISRTGNCPVSSNNTTFNP